MKFFRRFTAFVLALLFLVSSVPISVAEESGVEAAISETAESTEKQVESVPEQDTPENKETEKTDDASPEKVNPETPEEDISEEETEQTTESLAGTYVRVPNGTAVYKGSGLGSRLGTFSSSAVVYVQSHDTASGAMKVFFAVDGECVTGYVRFSEKLQKLSAQEAGKGNVLEFSGMTLQNCDFSLLEETEEKETEVTDQEINEEQTELSEKPKMALKAGASGTSRNTFEMYVNGTSLRTGVPEIPFGDTVSIRLEWPSDYSNVSDSTVYAQYKEGMNMSLCTPVPSGDYASGTYRFETRNRFSADSEKNPYMLFFSITADNGSTKVFSDQDLFYVRIVQAALKAPTISWDGRTANFYTGSSVTDVSATPGSYSYTIYRNGVAVGTGTGSSVDITPYVSANGAGKYSVSAVANIREEDANYFKASDAASSDYPDTAAPEILDFSVSTVIGRMSGTMSDSGTGIKEYAFSKTSTKGSVPEAERIAADVRTPGTNLTYTHDAESAGTYYLHGWDWNGNETVSMNGIACSEVDYREYYVNNEKTEYKEYLLQSLLGRSESGNGIVVFLRLIVNGIGKE